MAIIKRRNRIVLFRLSQDEYEGLRAACTERGVASISSFARSEILRALDLEGSSGVGQQLSCLQSSVQRITEILETMTASKEPK